MNEAEKATRIPQIAKLLKGKILDIGCGEQRVTEDAYGVDGRELPGIWFVSDDPYDLKRFVGRKWDVVFSSHFLEHLKDQYGAVREWIRCVKPGGYLILYLPDGRHYDNHENKEHMVDMNHDDFIFWFKRVFCGDGWDFRGKRFKKLVHLEESGLDVGEDRYSFYVIARKPMDLCLEFPNVEGTIQVYMDCLRAICGDTAGKSMIDIGSKTAPHTPLLYFKERMYVDIQDQQLHFPDEQKYFYRLDALNLILTPRDPFDVSIASDSLEHFHKDKAYELLAGMEQFSKKQIIFTPLGDHIVTGGDDPNAHHSGWMPADLPGYASILLANYHPTLKIGAFFSWRADNIRDDFERVKEILEQKDWAQ